MRINLILSEIEAKNLTILLEKYGGRATEYFRTLLRNAFEKEYGGYKFTGSIKKIKEIKEPEQEMTLEQKCEFIGGQIVKDNAGSKVCKKWIYKNKFGESFIDIPLRHDLLDQEIKAKKNTEN